MKKSSVIFVSVVIVLVVFGCFVHASSNSKDLESMPKATSGSSFLEEEAGITAYTKLDSIDLSEAKEAFKNIEIEDEDYLVGSIAIADYREATDVHVYVDTSGWIAAYYVNTQPASKIIDWRHYDPSSGATHTALERAIIAITDVLSVYVDIPYFRYCDFRYPDADKIIIATDEIVKRNGTENFQIKIPENFTIYSQSWSHYGNGSDYHTRNVKITIDETILNEKCTEDYQDNWKIWTGEVKSSLLSLGVYHTISTISKKDGYSSYVGLAVVYSK